MFYLGKQVKCALFSQNDLIGKPASKATRLLTIFHPSPRYSNPWIIELIFGRRRSMATQRIPGSHCNLSFFLIIYTTSLSAFMFNFEFKYQTFNTTLKLFFTWSLWMPAASLLVERCFSIWKNKSQNITENAKNGLFCVKSRRWVSS